jgi:hypothetical protein
MVAGPDGVVLVGLDETVSRGAARPNVTSVVVHVHSSDIGKANSQ